MNQPPLPKLLSCKDALTSEKETMICRAVSEQVPRTVHKFSSVVIVLLKMALSLMCQNDLDGVFVTRKVADCAVRAYMGHASADHVEILGK